MANAVFYAVNMDGTGDKTTGSPNIEITSGVATLSVAQTGNIGAGYRITYDTTSFCYIAPNSIKFDSGSTEISQYDQIEGGTSGATAIVRAIVVQSGTWGGGDAAGEIFFKECTGTWQDDEDIDITKPDGNDQSNAATTNGTQLGNMSTTFRVLTATGGDPGNQTSISVDSIAKVENNPESFIQFKTESL